MNAFSRSQMLLGNDGIKKLNKSHVAIFGVGGVGGNCIETLVRSGVGEITIIDNDTVSLTNLNRQIIALHSTLNQYKVDVMKKRLLDINPDVVVHTYKTFVLEDTIDTFDFHTFDYIVDAIDTISAKILLIEKAKTLNIQIISSMGTGNKLDPSKLEICDISKRSYCPLAKVMRRELKKRHINKVKVLASSEKPIKPFESNETSSRKQIPGSVAFVPNVAGIMIAGEVVLDLMKV
ncbi:tRNA threonylcarbamoyladenosine dehydratase [Breznakia sp. OttesenSCG-928-G09]|nr:tRNA threonylcarbamoyladenosine dehydratase [Breznakia sp. OttesenSCG-928-G09]